MRIGILGPLVVRASSGAPIDMTAAGPRQLLLRLAVDAGRVVSTATLIDDLWPSAAPVDPAGALQTLIARLRRTLGPDRTAISSRPTGYALDIAPADLDATRFAGLVDAARADLRAGHPADAANTLRAALALWRGPALADAPDAEFAIAPRARLAELRDSAELDRIAADLAVHPPIVDAAVLVAELEELCLAHPLRERPAALLIDALLRTGRRADALAAYDRIRARLADELGMDPSQELRDAHQAALNDEPLAAAPSGNLPAARSSFVGRDDDLAQLRELLASARLVTLTGFGGVGKTRLAIEAAAGQTLPDGTWLVELASVAEPGGIAPAILAAFGRHGGGLLGELSEPGAAIEPQARLLGVLADKSLLLVLDNCEQIIDGVAELADRLLSRLAGLRILATSREPLGITGEARYPVSPLGAAAVQLFVERGLAASPGLRLDADTTADIERICHELDGIPLAIELAAARLSSLTPHQLAERIDARFGLLGKGARTANARHRTLRAALDWSWELLDEPEQVLLRRLAVFAGGAELGAIERICATPDALDLISGLVDKSLVLFRQHENGTVRYGLLATLREYAGEKLAEAGEQDELRLRHARHYAEFAAALEPRLRTAAQLDALAALDGNQRNLDAALGYACALPAPEIALALVAANMWRWSIRGQRVEARHWSAEALRVAGAAPRGFEHEYDLCRLVVPQRPALAAAGELLRSWRHPAVLAASNLGRWPAVVDMEAIQQYYFETANWMIEQPEPWLRATGEFSKGIIAAEFVAGGAREAVRHLRASLAAFTGIGDRWGLFYASYQLCQVLDQLGDYQNSADLLVQARSYAQALGGADSLPVPLMTLIHSAELHTKAADYDTAAIELDEADATAQKIGDPVAAVRVLHARGELARRRGEFAEAVRLHRDTVRLSTELAEQRTPADGLSPQFVARAHSSLGRALVLAGEPGAAREPHGRAIALLATTIDAPVRAGVLESAAEWCVAQGHAEAAAVLVGAATALRGEDANLPEVRAVRERCLAELGAAAFQRALDRGQALSEPALSNLDSLALPEN
ncbi:MAG TPA: BTAD domain-containing putative transcriptional regulator [Pseudonocardiaceae bacterium]|nr:BTAD domain-containing putative transcriptional regulator [Pseudonocardiaceae bacterium]